MNLRDDKGKIKSNVLIATVFAAMLVAMVPAVMAITTANQIGQAEAQGVMDQPYVKAFAGSTALYEPNAGKTNVFGPGGIFPFFNDTFSCGDAITCGVQTDASFRGVFSEGAENAFVARYEAPITYGDHQVAGHTYRVELVDTKWNNDSLEQTPLPTRTPDFLLAGDGVAFDQYQHGHSMVDRADVPLFWNKVAMYGHVNVYDESDNDRLVAENLFMHLMVGTVVDETAVYADMQNNPATPLVVAMFIVNIPSGVVLPGDIGPLTSEQAQSFTPLSDDLSLTNPPPINYAQLAEWGVDVQEPMPQSTPWSVDNPTQPVFFTFLLFTNAKAYNSSTPDVPGVN
ncbi:hypothetical protein [Candidatus Nitrososphaera sp. FF02]|uniref:hypothetical protein n=1 Tax=Candidatus Nitrososphaera sp. FF02 TaxID=3398226 RepID=UPI0039ED6484